MLSERCEEDMVMKIHARGGTSKPHEVGTLLPFEN